MYFQDFYRNKKLAISKVRSLEELVVRKQRSINSCGSKYKTNKGYLMPYVYTRHVDSKADTNFKL